MSPPLSQLVRHYFGAQWRHTHLHAERLTAFQENRAKQIVRFAITHSPYYAERFAGYDWEDWRNLPQTDKFAMMADFSRFNSVGISGDVAMQTALRAEQERDFRPTIPGTNLTVGLSSGTSGHRGLFIVSPRERAEWAGVILARALPGNLLRREGWRIAFFHRAGSNLYESLGSRAVQFRFADLMTPIPDAVALLNAFMPHILVAPPTLLGMLAKEQYSGELLCYPERIFSVAEVLEPQDNVAIATAFDLPAVDQIYQCTEGLLGVSCHQHRLHWQEDIVAVQFEALADVERAERFTPILTDLWRMTQPIIRYRLGDTLRLAPPQTCTCGSSFRIIEHIEGRCDDVCYFPTIINPKVRRPFFPDTLRRAVLLAHPEISDYRIVQEQAGAVTIWLESDAPDFTPVRQAVQERLQNTLTQYDCFAEQVQIESGLPPEPQPTRKRRRVLCLSPSPTIP